MTRIEINIRGLFATLVTMVELPGAMARNTGPSRLIREPRARPQGYPELGNPGPGLLFLFPSWLFHQVRPYRGTGRRISIAFNLGVSSAASG